MVSHDKGLNSSDTPREKRVREAGRLTEGGEYSAWKICAAEDATGELGDAESILGSQKRGAVRKRGSAIRRRDAKARANRRWGVGDKSSLWSR